MRFAILFLWFLHAAWKAAAAVSVLWMPRHAWAHVSTSPSKAGAMQYNIEGAGAFQVAQQHSCSYQSFGPDLVLYLELSRGRTLCLITGRQQHTLSYPSDQFTL